MLRKVRGHIRNNVVGYVALFFALGLGTAWAAGLERNSVTSAHIKNGQVKSPDVRDDSLTGADIKEARLALPAGPVDLNYVRSDLYGVAANSQSDFASAECPPHESVIGGGVLPDGSDRFLSVHASFPGDNTSDADTVQDDRWVVYVNNTSNFAEEFNVYAICAEAASVR